MRSRVRLIIRMLPDLVTGLGRHLPLVELGPQFNAPEGGMEGHLMLPGYFSRRLKHLVTNVQIRSGHISTPR